MNKTLYITSLKVHRTLFIIINAVLLMYSSIMIYMFDPAGVNAMMEMINMLPEGIGIAFGFDQVALTLTTHVGAYLYGFIFVVFPMIFVTIMANSLMAKHVDRGSMVYLISTPNSRKEIAITQAASLLTMIAGVFVIQTALGILMANAMHPGLLEVGPYIQINLITMMVFFFVGSISFLASCIFNETTHSLGVGVGIPIMLMLFKMLSGAGEKLEFLRKLTPFSLMDIGSILENGDYSLWVSVSLLSASIAVFIAAIAIFDKRNLNI